MSKSLLDRVSAALRQAGSHNSQVMVAPEVILWPDPDRQWAPVIPMLRKEFPHLLVLGEFDPAAGAGPAIWLKCMVARTLPEANWPPETIPILYLPGIGKADLRTVENVPFHLLPLAEYQYTGSLFLQENGKEWTVLAFVENPLQGLGIKVARDSATREGLLKALPALFRDKESLTRRDYIDAEFLYNSLFPDILPHLLKWMCQGDRWLQHLPQERREIFPDFVKAHYGIEADQRLILDIARKLGTRQGAWAQAWAHYALAPDKYPQIADLLRQAMPQDLGIGDQALPKETWPQVNEQAEADLANLLVATAEKEPPKALDALQALDTEHGPRRSWVWAELKKAPLAGALEHLIAMAALSLKPFPHTSLQELTRYYTEEGFKVDQRMRHALAWVRSERDKEAVQAIIRLFYEPWLKKITGHFQRLVEEDPSIFTMQQAKEEKESYVLFVDAFRYELAEEFTHQLVEQGIDVHLETDWSSIPSVTPTAKPQVSPIADRVAEDSLIDDFRPRLKNGKDLVTANFREALKEAGYTHVSSPADISGTGKYWQEIGDIDTKGHQEGANIVRQVKELFRQVEEAITTAFGKGIRRVRIVTDHGWLLLPGGLPKRSLNKGLTETKWGRCALIKEGAPSDLLHLPWRWNPMIHVAYAPDISFFKANEEYAHGGISLHECLVPVILAERSASDFVPPQIREVKWVNLKCTIQTTDAPDGYIIDLRTKYNDPSTSIILSSRRSVIDNTVTVMVDDAAEAQAVTIVLTDPQGRILDKKPATVGEN